MKNELVQNFKTHLKEDGKSVKTIESYVGDTSVFVTFPESKGVEFTGELKRFYITIYRSYLIANQYELSTINKKVNSIQSFNHKATYFYVYLRKHVGTSYFKHFYSKFNICSDEL